MRNFKYITQTTIAFMALCMPFLVHAATLTTENSIASWSAEGNGVCKDYSLNSIFSINIGSKDLDNTSFDEGGVSVDYSIHTSGSTLDFSEASIPINYVLLKHGKYIQIFLYSGDGSTWDEGLAFLGDLEGNEIESFSLCYGINVGELPVEPLPDALVTPNCTIGDSIDSTGVFCPNPIYVDGKVTNRALVCNFELDKPKYGIVDDYGSLTESCCVCNATTASGELEQCDPKKPATEFPEEELAEGELPSCFPSAAEKLLLPLPAEVTTRMELNNDPYYCMTYEGSRVCYKY